MKKNIVLIGLMGSGKTTLGRYIAKKSGLEFVDTDELIIQKAGKPISEIFEDEGELYFRDLEAETIKEASEKDGAVISTGGGAVLRDENIENLQKSGILFYLQASPETLYERVKDDDSRPLLRGDNPVNILRRILTARAPYYEKADFTINTETLSPEQASDKIIRYTMDLLIKNGFVVTSKETQHADVLVKNGKIIAVQENISDPSVEVIDATNMLVMPGGVDVHTHFDMPFMRTVSNDDFETGTIAAAFGGTTSIVDYVIPSKRESLKKAVDKWHKKAVNKAVIDYGFHVAIVPPLNNAVKELSYLAEAGITSIKCFMAYKNAFMLDDVSLFQLFEEAQKHKILVCVHAENGEIIDLLQKKFLKDRQTDPVYHAYSRPAELEAEAVSRAVKLSEITKTPLYFVHLSTKEAIKEINRAKNRDNKVFAETCPQYMVLSESKYYDPGFQAAKYVMSPPLRGVKHCEYLRKSLINGNIDTIATDHCSFNFNKDKQKGVNNFTLIPNGIPGVETRMPIMYNEMVVKMGMDVSKFVDVNCTRPAKIFGMEQKGDIKPGKDADIAIWNPDLIWKIKKSGLHENVDYTPYEDYVVTGKPITVISRGEILIENNQLKARPGRGQFIKREISELAY